MMQQILMLSLSILAILQAAATPPKAIPPCPCYSLLASPAQQTVKIGDPIKVEIAATNTMDHDIYVPQSIRHPEDLYFVDVKNAKSVRQKMTNRYSEIANLLHARESGESPRPTAYRDKNGTVHIETYQGSAPPPRIVKPGQTVMDTILLNDLYSLDKAGTYTVQMKKRVGQKEIVSNVVTIKVTD
jgi:hypothetical protein